ncbi:uncharacterized protein SAPINGB_P003875 [Magnusiomyces paraingens]|uniref:DUF8032 domain-containing protein n=1 Tax=Magnusiomyces paraingens TaxID=2606893 RepID=A0A5E8BX07_9ASCO|nr:uncharacterized protein SAPINGB_P003875 [Saprochaete ingens]VVT54037.1 unnamed protein product [Saprochaete ingens]
MTFSQDFLNTCQNTTSSLNKQNIFLSKNCPSVSQPQLAKDSPPFSITSQDSSCSSRNRLGSQSSITSIESNSSSDTSVSSYFSESLSPKSLSSSSSSLSSLNSKPNLHSTSFSDTEFNEASSRMKNFDFISAQGYSSEVPSKMHGLVANNNNTNNNTQLQMSGTENHHNAISSSDHYTVPSAYAPHSQPSNYPFVTLSSNCQPQYSPPSLELKPTVSSSHHSSREHRSNSTSNTGSSGSKRHGRHSHSAPSSGSSSSSLSSSISVTSIAALVSSPIPTPVSVSVPAPSPIPAPSPSPTPTTVYRDNEGVDWITFTYSKDRIPKEHRIRCDIESVDINNLTEEFKKDNCIYPRACVVIHEYRGNRWEYETQCNAIGWCLTWINPSIRKRRGLIQRAVDNWRNTNADPSLRSRRVRRMSRKNDKMKCSTLAAAAANVIPSPGPHLGSIRRTSASPSSIIYQQSPYTPETPTAPYYYYTNSDSTVPQIHQQQQPLANAAPTPLSQQYQSVVMYEQNPMQVYPNQFMVSAPNPPPYHVNGQLVAPSNHSTIGHHANYR